MAEFKKVLSETIHEDLKSTFDAMIEAAEKDPLIKTEEETDDAVREGEEEEGQEEEIETTSDEAGKPSEDDDESMGEGEEEESEETTFEPGNLEPNSGWDKETQEGFKQLPEPMQEFMLKRYNEMQSDYTRKTKDVAGIKRALEPAREDITEANLTDEQAIANLVQTHLMLKSKPFMGIQYLMTAYGITLDDVSNNWQDTDSFVQNLKESSRLNKVETQLDAMTTEKASKAVEAQIAEIEEFKASHEHFDLVEEEMKQIARSMIVSRQPKPSLDELYEKALWLNPQTREMMIEEKKRGEEKPKSGKDVKDAKKASTRIKATPKKKESKPERPATLTEELSQAWDKAAGA